MIGGTRDDIEDRVAIIRGGGNVQEAEFVRPCRIIGSRRLDRVACVDQIDEVHALDDTAVFHVQAGNNASF